MFDGQLIKVVDQWSVQSAASGRFLLGLYRRLGDGKQAARVSQATDPSFERVSRLGLGRDVLSMMATYQELEVEPAEDLAWIHLLEASGGICALVSFAAQQQEARTGFKSLQKVSDKAFKSTIQGYRTAFPESYVEEGMDKAFTTIASVCAQVLMQTGTMNSSTESLERMIKEGLRSAVAE